MRARVLLIFCSIYFVLTIVWGGFHLDAGNPGTAALFFGCTGMTVAIVVKLLVDGNLAFASHTMLLFALVGISAGTFFTGGLRDTNVTSFFMLTVTAIFLLGRWGLIWAVAGLLVALGYQVATWRGYAFPDSVSAADRSVDSFLTWSSAFVVVLLFVLFYDRSRSVGMQQLREADRAKSRFIASISHELRTPLHVIMGMNRLMERTEPTPKQEEYLATSVQNTEVLLALIDDLLDISSIEHDKFVLKMNDFSPKLLAEEVSAVLGFAAGDKGLEYRLEVSEDLPAMVVGDRRRLAQVLLNIGGNAVKFTQRGSIALSARPEGDHLVFEVTDTGPGILAEDRERIFQSFTRGTTRQDGAGLGLFISSEIMERMGGEIDLDTRPGEGTTFTVRIPLVRASSTAAA